MNKYYVSRHIYRMTLNQFYKVTKETDKTVWLTLVHSKKVDGDCWSGHEVPTDDFELVPNWSAGCTGLDDPDPNHWKTHTIKVRKTNKEYEPWDGKPCSFDHLD